MIVITVPALFLIGTVALLAPDHLEKTMAAVTLVLTTVFAILNEFGP